MITLVDLGPGATLEGALDQLGLSHRRAATPAQAAASGPLVLAGCGPFEPAGAALKRSGWWYELPQLAAAGRPVLGIGLGFHLLAEGSEEAPRLAGLALLPGIMRALGPGVRIPHLGWTRVHQHSGHPGLPDPRGAWMYFKHAHAMEPTSLTLQQAQHGRPFSVLEMRGACMGLQAHPEKSGAYGLVLLGRILAALGEVPAPDPDRGAN